MKKLSLKEVITIGALLLLTLQMTACAPNTMTSGSISADDTSSAEGIIGGSIVSSADGIAQSTVILYDTEQGALCTGNIIDLNLILTAAHCTQLHPEKIIAIFSQRMPQSAQEMQKMVFRRIVSGKTTAAWSQLNSSKTKDWGDLAILKFDGVLPMGYKPAKLLTDVRVLNNGMTVTLAGFGITDGVRQTETDALRKVDVTLADIHFGSTELMMDQRQGKGACHGDSGGPALVKVGSSDVIVGITSRGQNDPDNNCSQYSVYTSVAAQASWIQKTKKEVASVKFRGGTIAQPAGR